MSFVSFLLFLTLFSLSLTIPCPTSYNSILYGCYKINNRTNLKWSDARRSCINESKTILNRTRNFTTHLVAFESAIETTSVLYWMKAWSIRGKFWTDGVASSWNWSNQRITWYFNSNDQLIYGNGSNYKICQDTITNNYQVVDDVNERLSSFICEYQERCDNNNECQNNATCYLNVGRELCICAPGFTGTYCEQEIDECLSSPCQHGGKCTDGRNNYTCDCSDLLFHGNHCEEPNDDPTKYQRLATFWSVFAVVCSLMGLLTLSDLPWADICVALGSPCYRFKLFSRRNFDNDDGRNIGGTYIHNLPLSDFPYHDENSTANQIGMLGISNKGSGFHVMNAVWNPEYLNNEDHSINQQHRTVNNSDIESLSPNQTTSTIKNSADEMINWKEQLKERLQNKQERPTSSNSTKPLIESASNDNN